MNDGKRLWVLSAVMVVGMIVLVAQSGSLGGLTASTSSSLSYSDAVARYGSRRIQFNSLCQASPANMTFKNGTSIMLDNRSDSARTVTVDSVKYVLPAFGWKIAPLSSFSLPKSLYINCGTSRNSALVILQN